MRLVPLSLQIMLYALLALSSRHALRWCYREVHVVGSLPATGPLLLAVNHPNDLADICVVLAHVPRRVNFVANVSAAEQPIVAWAYEQMGVIPVHRVRDARKAKARGEDSAQANALAFTRVRDVLAANGCVCVFPEGGVNTTSHLGALRNGLARMALEARDHAALRNVRIIPVGITYESRYEKRTRVLVEFGESIEMDKWQAPEDRAAAPQLTAHIASQLRAITRNAPDEHTAAAMRAVAAVVAASTPRGDLAMHVATHVWCNIAAQTYGPGIAEPVHENTRVQPSIELWRDIERAMPGTTGDRALIAWSATHARSNWSTKAAVWWRLPLGLLGGAIHWWVWRVISAKAQRAAATAADVIPRCIVPGLYMMVAWYAALAMSVSSFAWWLGFDAVLATLAGIAVLVCAPRLGDAAMNTLDWWNDRRLVAQLRTELPDLSDRLAKAARAADAPSQDVDGGQSALSPAHNVALPI